MIVSIDIGTSYSSICVQDGAGKAQPVDTATGTSMYGSKYSLPSAVFVEDSGKVLVGQAAMNNRRNKPGQFCMEFKRNIGQDIPIFLGNNSFLPEDFYREIFLHMKDCVKKSFGKEITRAYITCPAAFGKKKREKILGAAKNAGLFDVSLVDEPTAAACSYMDGSVLKDGQKLLLYDFGGGTFDVSLLSYSSGSFSLLAEPGGIEQCGGIDLDRCIYQDMLAHIDREILQQLSGNPLYKLRFECQLGELAVKIKHQLSSAGQCEEFIPVGWESVPYTLTQEHFNAMAAPFVSNTIDACRAVLNSAGLSVSDLSAVLLVGGTSRVPLVRSMVQQFAGNVPVYSAVDLELAVAMGAMRCGQMQKEDGLVPSKEEIEKWYQMGLNYANGDGVSRDEKEAVRWYRKAAEQGHSGAQTNLGASYYSGTGVAKNYAEAVRWFRKAAEQESDIAQINLGLCYRFGRGVTQNYEEAVKWYRKAAEQDNADAQNDLGYCYKNGYGVVQNYAEAVEWYRKAVDQDHAGAQNNLGECYYYGWGVAQNYEEAVKWYRKAAEKGNVEAQKNLGFCYKKGSGVEKNMSISRYWYEKANSHS